MGIFLLIKDRVVKEPRRVKHMLMSEALTSCDLSYRLIGRLWVSPPGRQPH